MAVKTNYTKNGINYYRLTKTIGKKADGTAIKKEFYGTCKADAENKASEYIQNLKSGLNINYDKLTLAQAMKDWLFNVLIFSENFKSTSFQRYECVYRNYIQNSDIGGIYIYSLKKGHIQNYYNDMFKNGATNSKISNTNKVLKIFFNYCVTNNIILSNPCIGVTIPKADEEYDEDKEDNAIVFFNENETKLMIKSISPSNTLHMIVFIALLTGMRLGEIMGLKNKFLNIANKEIKVRLTLAKVKVYKNSENYSWELKLQKPKTDSSIRTVTIPDNAVPLIQEYINYQKIKYQQNGLEFNEDSLLFTTNTCNKLDKSNFTRAWKRYLKRMNIDYKKFHATRHTFASILFKNGATISDVKSILGHSNIRTTEKIYIHIFPETKKAASNKLNYLLSET